LSLVGKQGLKDIAELNIQKMNYLKQQITNIPGYKVLWQEQPRFNEVVVQCPISVQDVNQKLLQSGIIGGYPLENHYAELKNSILFCITEKRTKQQIDNLISQL
jgi:glycine dehydrogenase subunit 1